MSTSNWMGNAAQRLSLFEVSTFIVEAMQQDKSLLMHTPRVLLDSQSIPHSDLPSMRRRIYDAVAVIRVVRSLGVIVPAGTATKCQCQRVADRIRFKQTALTKKKAALENHRALIERNRLLARPATAITLPTIIVAIRAGANGAISRSLDARTVVIKSSVVPRYLGPAEILTPIFQTKEDPTKAQRPKR
jgi:hypothetical protein